MTDDRQHRSHYVAYVDEVTAETCCSVGHETRAEAARHALQVMTERQQVAEKERRKHG